MGLRSSCDTRSDSKAPLVKVLTPHDLLMTAQKEMDVERGPSEVAGIRMTYDLK
jgi:hypothetical protein